MTEPAPSLAGLGPGQPLLSALAPAGRARVFSQCRHHRQAVRDNHGTAESPQLRCRPEGEGPPVPCRGRHHGPAAGGGGAQVPEPGSGRCAPWAGAVGHVLSPSALVQGSQGPARLWLQELADWTLELVSRHPLVASGAGYWSAKVLGWATTGV